MFEGKNIHYSPIDQKPLCSFSGKVCNQRRLNKYGFCVRHILEDHNAPFKRCAYVAKSSRQTCTQPIPKNEEREYCNNHMQVLGMLPKKERKPKKEKDKSLSTGYASLTQQHGHLSDPLLLQNKVKPRHTVGGFKAKIASNKLLSSTEEVDDVYAFPADSSELKPSSVSTLITSVAISEMSPNSSKAVTYNTYTTKTQSDAGQSSLAKIYPELAEKLEKIKPRIEPKVKGKVKSSRTMNSLQTKIAQNKIKDKLKRNQCSSNTSSQSQSPSHGFTSASSPGYHIGTSSPSVPVVVSSPQVPVTSQDTIPSSDTTPSVTSAQSTNLNQPPLPSLSQFNLLKSLDLPALTNLSFTQLGVPVPTTSDLEQTLKQLVKAANFPPDGATVSSESLRPTVPPPPAVPVPGLPAGAFLPQSDLLGMMRPLLTSAIGPPPPYSSLHHKPVVGMSQVPVPKQVVSSVGNQSMSDCLVTNAQSAPISQVTRHLTNSVPISTALSLSSNSVPLSSSSSLPFPSSVSSPHLQNRQISLASSSSKTSDSVKVTVSSADQPKTKAVKQRARSRNPSTASKRPVPVFTLPMTVVKPRKIRKLLDTKEVNKLTSKSAIRYYENYKQDKQLHHNLILSGFSSSDESDMSDCDTLPWQPEWFRASSDEEACDDDDADFDLRTTKLALTRARLRRQCFQARRAHRNNSSLCRKTMESTSTLITAASESPPSALRCLCEIGGVKPFTKDKYKRRGLEKRKCLYKDNDDVQCKYQVVPYTNHCIKHVMYNVDQQLFEYCTAKFADNTQCCRPVIDVKHELPLCMEHGLKADNFLKTQDNEPKPKRPRKKTKPSALTRPPKKGKKKKNQRKSARPQKPILAEEPAAESAEAGDSEEEHTEDHTEDGEEGADSDRGTQPSPDYSLTKSAILNAAWPLHTDKVAAHKPEITPAVIGQPQKVPEPPKPVTSSSNLEDIDNFTALSELENVKMFGDLPLETASKLLEENDFQDVLNKLPDEAFDIFNNKTGGLPSHEELEELENSLAMARESLEQISGSGVESAANPPHQQPARTQPQPLPPILDDADELTRQIAEEILNQNINSDLNLGNSLCNGDAQESIKAIARSLSNSGMMLTSEASQRGSNNQEYSLQPNHHGVPGHSAVPARSQSVQNFANLGQVCNPPNVAIHMPHSQSQTQAVHVQTLPSTLEFSAPVQGQPSYSAQSHPVSTSQNLTVNHQGMVPSQYPSVSSMFVPASQNVPIGNTAVAGHQALSGSQSGGLISFPGTQTLTPQQLSLVQATLQLPPLPPYIPRAQCTVQTTSQPAPSSKAIAVTATQKQLTQAQISQQQQHLQQQQQLLARQQEELTQQQHLLTQQMLQHHLTALAQQQQTKTSQSAPQSMNLSSLQLNQLGKINQQLGPSLPNIASISQLIKTSQQVPQTMASSGAANLPTTNIVWTAPPNVTVTSPNGILRNVTQSYSSKLVSNSVTKMKETFIDLTETHDPPPYETTQMMGKSQPPPSYPSQTLTTTGAPGKS